MGKVEVLWCANQRQRTGNGWRFPRKVAKLLQELTAGGSVVHLFGGQATFGVRLDIDPGVKPDVRGDAWLPPFKRDAFDWVILDPPYFHVNAEQKGPLFEGANFIARRGVIWFHTTWVPSGPSVGPFQRGWLIRVGDNCQVRCLQVFAIREPKQFRTPYFERGPQIRYNRWLGSQGRLQLVGANGASHA